MTESEEELLANRIADKAFKIIGWKVSVWVGGFTLAAAFFGYSQFEAIVDKQVENLVLKENEPFKKLRTDTASNLALSVVNLTQLKNEMARLEDRKNNINDALNEIEEKQTALKNTISKLETMGPVELAEKVEAINSITTTGNELLELKKSNSTHETILSQLVGESESWLSQAQAQAICASMAPRSTSVQAIYRRQTGTNSEGQATSTRCTEVCKSIVSVPYNYPTSAIGAVHIYNGRNFFSPRAKEATSKGLATYIYQADNSNDQFGPNYCCCGG
ncbi:MAG: hypothetical protein JAZ17_01890 [Candidatus Thiodiazotropha endolucinida]|nr:hypothetical protein [Candidatus Thiodiazotropha endolucinida]